MAHRLTSQIGVNVVGWGTLDRAVIVETRWNEPTEISRVKSGIRALLDSVESDDIEIRYRKCSATVRRSGRR